MKNLPEKQDSSNMSQDSEPPLSPPPVSPGEEAQEQMTAVILNSFGGLKNIKIGKRPIPKAPPAENMVNIKVLMSGINFHDVMSRLGVMESSSTPFVMGTECIGKVLAVGENVTSIKEDDIVYCLPENGAWADQIAVPQHLVFGPVNKKVPMDKLACSMPYLVADFLLGDSVKENSTILVHSAGGSVGLAVKDLAKNCNVIGIASKAKIEKLEGYKTLIERGTDYVAEIKKLHPSGIDLVLDSQGGEDCARGISILGPGGKYILFGSANIVTGETKSFFTMAKSWWQVEKVSPLKLYEENKTISGFNLRQLLRSEKNDYIHEKLKKIWKLMLDGKIQPVVDSTINFRKVTEGMSKLHERTNIGKILLNFEEESIPEPSVGAETASN